MLKLNCKAYNQLFTLLFIFLSVFAYAQSQGLSMQNLSTVNVEQLSDDQINQFWVQAQAGGVNLSSLETMAKQRKMPPQEFLKLKNRIEKLSQTVGTTDVNTSRTAPTGKEEVKDINQAFSSLKPKIFGADLFNNKNLSFEPNLKMATPQNYQLGADDELTIDVYGNSEITQRVKVSPEGDIRIPQIGPVSVGGLTIEQAKKRIINQLSGIYSGISSGGTFVNVSLSNIRSIKVTLLGEINMPGSYTLPSLATVFNALYSSGGPNDNGSFRNIMVIRDGKTIATIDVYEFLMKGDSKGNVRLQDQDVIKVSPYTTRVELSGEVKRPGLYETAKNENLTDVINFAGGFTDNAYKEQIKVIRNTLKEKSVADIQLNNIGTFKAMPGDAFVIDKLLSRYSNRVQINGAVFRPGFFAIEDGMTISSLIKKADGLKEDAFVDRAVLYRLREDLSVEVISFNVKDILAGQGDIPLKREDVIQVASKNEMHEAYKVTISGEVQKPGNFTWGQNMKVEDLIIAAGGLKEASSNKVEISRRISNSDPNSKNSEVATIIKYEINKTDLKSTSNVSLMPFDHITVFPSPGYSSQKNIRIEGEVLYPGTYTISNKNEKLSDIIARAGGLSAQAFPQGAILIRNSNETEVDKIIKSKKIETFNKQSSDTLKGKSLAEKETVNNANIVGINLAKILKKNNSKYDLLVEDNDIIRIPKLLETVQVSGEVLYPVKVRYEKGTRLNRYIYRAGGFTANSLKRRSYIVYANGTAASTKHFLFMNFYPKILPGSEIIVPVREDKRKISAMEIASIATSATTLVFLLVTIIPKL